ncbi:hypothetical protein ALC57_10120 [Trachymyrmex cornetzi]|uniref:Mos1 transposase HTH domain-containing protein n=1 Tax=Trachymyrmex cornetzi TaxID=471704 RepID=A0A151J4Q1_9HYME|nr:hypothetical protein ALC57_10120 [Trachymyrmex cornetzi]
MSVYEPNSRHLREVLIFCFNMKKSAAEAHQIRNLTYTHIMEDFMPGHRNVHTTGHQKVVTPFFDLGLKLMVHIYTTFTRPDINEVILLIC